MADRMSDEVQKAIARATEMVKDVPEDLRQVAFSKAFDVLVAGSLTVPSKSGSGSTDRGRVSATPQTAPDEENEGTVERLIQTLDRTRYPEVSSTKQARELVLRVLKAAAEDADEEWLSPGEITAVLREKFSIPIAQNTVRMALLRTGKLTDRKRRGDTFIYRIMEPGENLLAGVARSQTARKRGASRRTTKRTAGRGPAATADEPPDAKAAPKTPPRSSSRVTSGRPGPKKILEELLSTGFFDEPQTIGSIIKHLEVKRAHRYIATEIAATLVRLQREGKLDREPNADNQYEYRRHG